MGLFGHILDSSPAYESESEVGLASPSLESGRTNAFCGVGISQIRELLRQVSLRFRYIDSSM